jgi:hypothetical protein
VALAPMVASDTERAQQLLRPGLETFCAKILEGVEQRDRTCMRLYAEAMKIVGAQVLMAVNIWQQYGIADEAAGKRMIESAMQAHDLDPETAWRLSEQFVQEYRREHGLPELVEAKQIGAGD